jgi:hypothetical protein
MADYNINAVTRRVVYSGSAGTGPYAFSFEVLVSSDIVVYFNSTSLTLTTDYTVTINANGTGSVTIVTGTNVPTTPDANDTIIIVGARDIERTTDFVTAGDLLATSLNEQLDGLTIFDQQIAEEQKRSLMAPVYDPAHADDGGTLDMTLPAKADRLGKSLVFNATTGNPEAGPTSTDIANAQPNATAAAASATLASQWATKTDGQVASTDYSSKAWAIGGTGVTDTASAGAAKEWATAAEDDLVDGSEYSAKHYSAKASGFATNAETSATNAAASEAAAAAAAQGWADVVSITAGTTNIETADANKYYIVDASGGAVTLNLPAVGTSDGLTLAFEVLDATNAITIVRDGTDTINGVASNYTSLTGVGDVVHFISIDGTPDNWSARLISRFVVDDVTIAQVGRTIEVKDGGVGTTQLADLGVTLAKIAVAAKTQVIAIAASDETSDLTTGTAKATFRMPYAFTLTAVRASVTTAPTGATLTVDINESGTTILSTKITIDATEKTSTTAVTAPVISDSALADDSEITIDIDQIGSTIAGAGLKIYLIGYKSA